MLKSKNKAQILNNISGAHCQAKLLEIMYSQTQVDVSLKVSMFRRFLHDMLSLTVHLSYVLVGPR